MKVEIIFPEAHGRGSAAGEPRLRVEGMGGAVLWEGGITDSLPMPARAGIDDRTFMPEVRKGLTEAFAAHGALDLDSGFKNKALSAQYWNASWMAFCRSDKATALGYWCRAFWLYLRSRPRLKRPWIRQLLQYIVTLPKSCSGCG